jgi:2-hydroxyglutarate dehydrogenase
VDAPPARCDALVVGAGIVGLATARELLRRRPGSSVVVLEREQRVAAHQSSHNSGVIHAGVYYEPGSLKARLCVEGARALYEFCERRGVPHRRSGKLIVATHERELGRLDELARRAAANGVAARRLTGAQIAGVEPACRGLAALHVADTGVVDFARVSAALADEVAERGGTVLTGAEVLAAVPRGEAVAVRVRRTPRYRVAGAAGREPAAGAGAAAGEHELTAGRLIACAGAWSDRLAVASGAPAEPRIVPFRGAYAELRGARADDVRALIYPVPDPSLPFLGVHLTRGIDDIVHVGPTALLAGARDAYALHRVRPQDLAATLRWPGTWRMAGRWWRTGAREIGLAASRRALARAAARYVPTITAADLGPGGAGVRAQALARDGRLVDDFAFSQQGAVLHVRNAPSPAATSALALARHIADRAGA